MRVSDSIAVGILLLLAVQLQGCGRKGPLYLQQTPPPEAAAMPATVAPVPASSPSAATPILPNSTDPVKQP